LSKQVGSLCYKQPGETHLPAFSKEGIIIKLTFAIKLDAEVIREMGYVRTKVIIGDPQRVKLEEVQFLAHSGAFSSAISPSLAKNLDTRPTVETELTMGDKRRVKATLSLAYFKLLDREGVFQVAIIDVPEPLLGVTVLKGLGIKIDPCTRKLEYSRPYGLPIFKTCTRSYN